MRGFIQVQTDCGTKIAINVKSIANVMKVSYDTSYINFYTSDCDGSSPYKIERIAVRQSFDDIKNLIIESVI